MSTAPLYPTYKFFDTKHCHYGHCEEVASYTIKFKSSPNENISCTAHVAMAQREYHDDIEFVRSYVPAES